MCDVTADASGAAALNHRLLPALISAIEFN